MHEQAEIGIAAHFSYSEAGKSLGSKDYYWVNELKQIIDTTANTDFYQDMKIRIFDDQIFVLTPK